MTNQGEVYFALYGDEFDPELVTRLVGIQPTSVRRKGEPLPKCTTWKLSSGTSEGDLIDVYELSAALVSKLEPYTERIAEAMQQLELRAVLQVVLWITTDDTKPTPSIGFEREVIAFLNSVGASIDIDTYRNVASR